MKNIPALTSTDDLNTDCPTRRKAAVCLVKNLYLMHATGKTSASCIKYSVFMAIGFVEFFLFAMKR